MSERKGHLTSAGRVTWTDGPDVVADLSYHETRYNLVRVLVTREWRADVRAAEGRKARRFTGETRREVVAAALAYVAEDLADPTTWLRQDESEPHGFARPVPGCQHADEVDGTCGHPDALTPECWVALAGDTSDCPRTDGTDPAPLGAGRDGEWTTGRTANGRDLR